MSASPTRLLIIDDDPFVREVTEMTFTSAGGWVVHVADSGAVGVELAARVAVDVVLMDVQMPDLDGPATVAALQAADATRDVPVVFITADERSARVAAESLPTVVGVIAKPFDPMTLPDQVAACLATRAASQPDGEDALADALARLWDARRPETLDQVAALEAAVVAPDGDVDAARTLAHNLVGVLGSLGLHGSSQLARSIDRALRAVDGGGFDDDVRDHVLDVGRRLRELLATERPAL